MRQIVLDTETTGINPKEGHRIIEIGCVELIDRKLTGNTFHVYINPMREIEQEAINVHGITNEFLTDKPLFKNVVHGFVDFIKGAELIIHNAPFDVGFMDNEFALTDRSLPMTNTFCTILDTLVMARRMRPGQKNSLDALCKFYQVDNSRRTYHGALLDSEILAEVYLYMTGGQTSLSLNANSENNNSDGIENVKKLSQKPALKIIRATADDIARDEAIFG
ncbi:DNA polymerase III subunit epsilon [Glaciecola punicea ACAM 611]|jgi:DNA polymerase-3 subunit epsilon|uniref:DNA polymerase III subunit epsilon n=1 Tax=Glaciecola punicea ACAM 611 TaxID=1121923 RepID=H5T9E2_9ALTE|nr:DNA polymerase III subunit epsilon [Glaciecola punicea]OFA33191.1 DNA polymerase III subunit epsilon [Glaciecola punicea]GAB54919.1 DNA polymerase III subunit epsilon [Glaciecola punicea ACAM 611]